MVSQKIKRIAVIGAGLSGIAAAKVFQKSGYEVVIFEKSGEIGGVWANAYPEVRLQNISSQYHLSDFPWPFTPDLNPTSTQIRQYWEAVVKNFEIDVRLKHDVLALEEQEKGWRVQIQSQEVCRQDFFDYVVVATGQYMGRKSRPIFPKEAEFIGEIVTEREIKSLDFFNNKRIAVVGFGKSALDMTVLAAQRSQQVHHIFRTPRWLIPQKILGLHYTYPLFNRLNSFMIPSWAHPTRAESFLHSRFNFIVSGYWSLIESILRLQIQSLGFGKDQATISRLNTVQPTHSLMPDLRSASALAPNDYYRFIAEGRIQPHHAKVSAFSSDTIELDNGDKIPCDVVVLSLGSQTPVFPFLPQKYRQLLEVNPDGVQLYRHLIHPRIPNLAFVGFNHGFLHIPAVEIGTLWLCAYLDGTLELPSIEKMEQDIEQIRQWKNAHIHFETARGTGVNVRYQKYLDILLRDLGISAYRKMPNIFAEIFHRYDCSDYNTIFEDYNRNKKSRTTPVRPLALPT